MNDMSLHVDMKVFRGVKNMCSGMRNSNAKDKPSGRKDRSIREIQVIADQGTEIIRTHEAGLLDIRTSENY